MIFQKEPTSARPAAIAKWKELGLINLYEFTEKSKFMKTDEMVMKKEGQDEGLFQQGEVTGFGRKIWPNGFIYEGQILKGELEGYGRQIY